MQTLKKFLLIICAAVMLTGCGGNEFTHLTQDDAQRIMRANSDAVIVDVRTPEEFAKKHIPNARLVPIDELRAGDFSKLPDKNATLLIYCWTGRRAEDSAKILINAGYKKVYEFGGLVDWTGAVEGSEVDS